MNGFEVFLLLLAVLAPLYWLPTIVATKRHKVNAKVIGVLNFFVAWTIGGWFWLLIWSLSTSEVDQLKSGVTIRQGV